MIITYSIDLTQLNAPRRVPQVLSTRSEGAAMSLEFTADRDRIDLDAVHGFLTESYWARGIERETVRASIAGSACFAFLDGGRTVAFARVIADDATFAYLADVFVLPAYRGQGVGRDLVERILADERFRTVRRWLLRTLDAHGLYKRFGFEPIADPGTWMEMLPGGHGP